MPESSSAGGPAFRSPGEKILFKEPWVSIPTQARFAPDSNPVKPSRLRVIFLGGFRDGADGAGNVLRPWVRAVLGNPETWKNPNYPLVVNNSWGGGMDVDEEIALRMIRDSAETGRRNVPRRRWLVSRRRRLVSESAEISSRSRLYRGPRAPARPEVRPLGRLDTGGLSTESGALNARDPKVRDWMVTDIPADWKPEPFKGQTIDLGVPEAKQWAQNEVERIVTDYHLDMLEHDGYLVAHGCDRADHPHAAPDPLNKCIYKSWGAYWVDSSNSTDVSYHAVRAYYDIYSKLRHDHPGLLFEICNDGGRMVDFGSAAHGDYFSITDTYDPLRTAALFTTPATCCPRPCWKATSRNGRPLASKIFATCCAAA